MRSFYGADGRASLTVQPFSLERFFYELHEDSGGGSASVAVSWRALRFELGGVAQYSERDFDGR